MPKGKSKFKGKVNKGGGVSLTRPIKKSWTIKIGKEGTAIVTYKNMNPEVVESALPGESRVGSFVRNQWPGLETDYSGIKQHNPWKVSDLLKLYPAQSEF